MPKDPPRNQPNYKIGGYHINEYDFERDKAEISRQEENSHRPNKEMNKPDSENEYMEDQGVKSGGRSNSTP
jgi:hypothetical protein